ncbi:MAG: signal peptidase II [Firmicutes bacterium]|nr:signal peptidase II [Bacillota bacterium]
MPFFIAFAVAVFDQYTKALAIKKLAGGTIPIIKDIFHFTYVENTGAAFGIFKDGNTVFTIVTAIILIGIIVALIAIKPQDLYIKISSGLVLGGAVGNLLDRIFRGFVIDFLDFRVISYPVFNIADSFIVIGAIIICVKFVFFEKKSGQENAKI